MACNVKVPYARSNRVEKILLVLHLSYFLPRIVGASLYVNDFQISETWTQKYITDHVVRRLVVRTNHLVSYFSA